MIGTPLTCSRKLQKAEPKHPLLVDLEEKSELFDKAATKYKAKVSA
jgi:coatomer protein complex subunit epsilon